MPAPATTLLTCQVISGPVASARSARNNPHGHCSTRLTPFARRMGPTGTRPGALGQDGDGLGINAYGTEWRRTSRGSTCRAAPRQRVREKHSIVSDIPLPRCAKQYVGGHCRLHRAGLLARSAVDAFDGVDIHLAVALVDTVRRAILEAGPVEYVHACFGDDIGHNGQLPRSEIDWPRISSLCGEPCRNTLST